MWVLTIVVVGITILNGDLTEPQCKQAAAALPGATCQWYGNMPSTR